MIFSLGATDTVNLHFDSGQLKLDLHVLLLLTFCCNKLNALICSQLNDAKMHFYGVNWKLERSRVPGTAASAIHSSHKILGRREKTRSYTRRFIHKCLGVKSTK